MAGRIDVTRANLPRAIAILGMFFTAEQLIRSLGHLVEIVVLGSLPHENLAAATLSGVVLWLAFALPLELSTGVTYMVAKFVGAKDERAAAQTIGQIFLLCVVLSLPFTIFGPYLAPLIMRGLGAEAAVLELGVPYLTIAFYAMSVLVLPFPLNAALRALGNAAAATTAQVLQVAIVVTVLPILVLGVGPVPRLEAPGVIAALVIARAATGAFQVMVLRRQGTGIRFGLDCLRPNLPLMRSLLALSLAPACQVGGRLGAEAVLVRLVASFGTGAVAAYGILARILDFLDCIGQGFGNAAFTVISQNLSARRPDRSHSALVISIVYSTSIVGSMILVAVMLAPQLVLLLNVDLEVGVSAIQAMRIVTISFIANATTLVLARAFHGSGDTLPPFVIDLAALWLVQLPLAFALAQVAEWQLIGIWIAIASANLVRLIGLAAWFRYHRSRSVALPLHTQ